MNGSYRTAKHLYKLSILLQVILYYQPVATAPAPWQLTLARIEGALPFVSPALAQCVALASLRRLWRVHVHAYAFDNIGLEHNPGLEAGELVRSWYTQERCDFLSWITRCGPPSLAAAAAKVLVAKGSDESFTSRYSCVDRALERLDTLLPTTDPAATLLEWILALRTEEMEFFEGGSEIVEFEGHALTRAGLRGAAWAASLAAAMRPQLFALGAAPIALAGIAPRSLFRELHEEPFPDILNAALQQAGQAAATNLEALRAACAHGDAALGSLYASSTAPAAWQMIAALGPLTRAELARGLGVTKRTASQAVAALETAGLVTLRPVDSAILACSGRFGHNVA